MSPNKWARWGVFLAFNVVPVYEVSALMDTLIFNSIEFWTGKNPAKDVIRPLRTAQGKHAVATLRVDGQARQLELVREADALAAYDARGRLIARIGDRDGLPAVIEQGPAFGIFGLSAAFRPGNVGPFGAGAAGPHALEGGGGKQVTSLRSFWPGWIESSWDSLRSSYWLVPTLMAMAAVVAAESLVEIDRRVSPELIDWLPWVFAATAEGTRATLAVVAGSMITVTGVVFSITIVALTLASQQFGPRLLRNFIADRLNQVVLGTFVATFLYCLLVIRSVDGREGAVFVPHIATGGAVVLGAASLFVLIAFIHHAATSIQASSVIASVACEIELGIANSFPESSRAHASQAEEPLDDAGSRENQRSHPVHAARAGYIRVIDGESLIELARKQGGRIELERRTGEFAPAGGLLAHVQAPDSADPQALEELCCRVRNAFVLGNHRTPVQDLLFPLEQLTEMAVRALSPGVNDPRTAVACVHRLGNALASLAGRPDPSRLSRDEAGVVRVVAPVTSFSDLLREGIDPIRRYGAGEPSVCVALIQAPEEVVTRGPSAERRPELRDCAEEIRAAAQSQMASKRDLAQVEAAFERFAAGAGRV